MILLANPLSCNRCLKKACEARQAQLSGCFAIQPTGKTHDINTASYQDMLKMRFCQSNMAGLA
jgi:hypothetical protein